jgi:hypothetical protein
MFVLSIISFGSGIGSVLIWRQDFARTRQFALSPCFSQKMEEKSHKFAEKGNEIYAKAVDTISSSIRKGRRSTPRLFQAVARHSGQRAPSP